MYHHPTEICMSFYYERSAAFCSGWKDIFGFINSESEIIVINDVFSQKFMLSKAGEQEGLQSLYLQMR